MLPDYTTQLPGAYKVVSIPWEEVRFSYEQDPHILPGGFFDTGHQERVIPAPAYAHDLGLVEELLGKCHELAPLCGPVTISVMGVEAVSRTNGWASQKWCYYKCYTPDDCQCDVITINQDGSKSKKRTRNWDGIICLSGRTTEIHPAVARYVVPHEYGHIAEEQLGLIRHDTEDIHNAGRNLVKEWAKVRRIPEELFNLPYLVMNHHRMPSEIFANDFRHALGFETEWWPHEEVVPKLGARGTKRAQAWWDDALSQLRDCYQEAQACLASTSQM